MPRRICIDCGALTSGGGRCAQHQAEHEARQAEYRGTTSGRGYGADHQQAVRALRDHVRRVGAVCWICAQAFKADASDMQADHVVPLAEGGSSELANLAPAHAACNASRGGRLGV